MMVARLADRWDGHGSAYSTSNLTMTQIQMKKQVQTQTQIQIQMLTGWTWLNIFNNHKSHKNTNTKRCVKQVSQSRDTNQLSLKLFCQATLVSLDVIELGIP